jgi:hypothetical protein
MRIVLISALGLFCLPFSGACKKQDSPPPASAPAPTYQTGYPPPQSAYPPPQSAYPPPQSAYPPPQATYQQAPPPAPTYAPPATPVPPPPQTAPVPSASAAMAVPGPIAFQCQNDVPCGTHHCNLTYGKCAFPCQSNVDCLAPNTCVLGLCVPSYTPPPPK